MKKRVLCFLLGAAMVLGMAGCGQKPQEPTPTAGIQDGTYTGVGTGKGGEMKVEVTISGGAITAVNVT